MVMTQIHRSDRSECILARHCRGQTMRGYADAHAALDDGQQLPLPQAQRPQS
jgi:hypothetical protein